MADNKKDNNELNLQYRLKFAQLAVGTVLLIFMLVLDAFVKPVPIYVIAIPGFLIGIDLREIINGRNKG